MIQPKALLICSVQLFGWDLKSSWQTANQKRCDAFLRAGRLTEAHEAYRLMMDMSDGVIAVNCRDWSIGKSSVLTLISIFTCSLSFRARMSSALY